MNADSLSEVILACHQNSRNKGFWDTSVPFPQFIALVHSELSEALEAYRNQQGDLFYGEGGKPEGIMSELADAVIRIFDWAGKDHESRACFLTALHDKMKYNETREYRHGGKLV